MVTFGWLTWSHVGLGGGLRAPTRSTPWPWWPWSPPPGWPNPAREGWAFAAAAVAIGSVVASIFFELFPRVMVSTTNAAYNLTVANSASPSYTLKVMTVVAVIFFPVVLAYQGWSLYVFRKRIVGPTSTGDATPAGSERRSAARGTGQDADQPLP